MGRYEALRINALKEMLQESLIGATHTIEHDGFKGEVIGVYITKEGRAGVVLQQEGTRVVHVYGEKWINVTQG